MAGTQRERCCVGGSEMLLYGGSAIILFAERAALTYSILHYFVIGHQLWAGLTFTLTLPACAVQLLSFYWFSVDGERKCCFLVIIHILQLGIYKRYWDCAWSMVRAQRTAGGLGAMVMQQGDVSALHLLEALLLSLPQTLLQSYLLVTAEISLITPAAALCSSLSLLSLSWALVLHSRASCLILPGHLSMPPAALLCQLLWRAGMLWSRVTTLVLFARAYHWWVFGVGGLHWLAASFWLVTQQSDIFKNPWHWRLFSCTLGAVHVFCFINVKYGPSRFRMSAFYAVMLLENATLLLFASDFLQVASWDSMGTSTAVLCSFLVGGTALVLYYRFLHPKSTEISLSYQSGQPSSACWDKGSTSFSPGDKDAAFSPPLQTYCTRSPTGVTETDLEHGGISALEPPVMGTSIDEGHHHWLLLRLALKTGDLEKIHRSYGAGGATAILGVVEHKKAEEKKVMDEEEKDKEEEGKGEDERDQPQLGLPLLLDPAAKWDHAVVPFSEDEDTGETSQYVSLQTNPLEAQRKRGLTPGGEYKRGCPEGRSVGLLEDPEFQNPESKACNEEESPTDCSSTTYFSADPQSPDGPAQELPKREDGGEGASTLGAQLAEFSPIAGDAGKYRGSGKPPGFRALLSRRDPMSKLGVEPQFTSTPKSEPGPQNLEPRAGGARRQLVPLVPACVKGFGDSLE
ncbi:XK-related protein 5a [Huso huso]|uniref:XK-related protein n=1 Tax=Huso huso TaxID=61971 RepID=A0ABR0ZVM4_HUSHU